MFVDSSNIETFTSVVFTLADFLKIHEVVSGPRLGDYRVPSTSEGAKRQTWTSRREHRYCRLVHLPPLPPFQKLQLRGPQADLAAQGSVVHVVDAFPLQETWDNVKK
jgi:hypothetical protein